MTKKTINDAIKLVQSLIDRLERNNEENAKTIKSHLSSAATILAEMRDFLGGEYALDENSAKEIMDGAKYDTQLDSSCDLSELKVWTEQFNAAVFQFKSKCTYIQGQNSLVKNQIHRKRILKGIFISAIILAVIAAAFAIYGTVAQKGWANDFATVLGIIDFTVGIVGFSIERISDMKAQELRRSLIEIDCAIAADNLEKANKAATSIIIACGKNSQASGRDSNSTKGKNSPIITGNGNSIN